MHLLSYATLAGVFPRGRRRKQDAHDGVSGTQVKNENIESL